MTEGARIQVQSTRFGTIHVPEATCFTFPEGVLGFPGRTKFALFDNPGGGPLKWLQSMEDAALAFVCCDPALFLPGYRVAVHKDDLSGISLDRVEDGYVLVILVIGKAPSETTANLLGPLLFNLPRRLGRQLVLADTEYSSRFPLFAAGKAP